MTSRRLAYALIAVASLIVSGNALAQCPLQAQAGQAVSPGSQNLSSGSSITYQWSPSVAALVLGSYEVWVKPSGTSGNGTKACT
ncbi:MAG TPA: hypothetical protein VGR02_15980, partial [Thermoanaerobaculia bacterium]|nr:hypothetical protein [Thermoanaerobaculia bacterium]